MPKIDQTAQVHPRAQLADDAVVGPFCIVGENVRIGAGTVVEAHSVITGNTEIGANNHFFPFTSIGAGPQDHSYRGEPTRLVIGDRNHFREFVTANTGTVKGGGVTIIGSDNLFMACSHVAHDCVVGDRVVMANCSSLAGHVRVESGAIFSAYVGVHHFVTVGAICMLGGLTAVTRDIPPYMMVNHDDTPRAVNMIGMKRNGFSEDEIASVQKAFRLIYRSGKSKDDVEKELADAGMLTAPARNFIESLRRSEKGKFGRHLEITRMEIGGAP